MSGMEPLNKFFNEIDTDFINLKKITDDIYVYNATDVLVQSTWELPIVIQWPESTVKFEFSCSPSDISFGVVFVAAPEEDQDLNDLEIETIEEVTRVDSSLEPVCGSFDVPCEGVIFFLFDNNYDWTANKKISYLIEVMQPSFTHIDEVRTERSLVLLKDVVEDLDVAFTRHADAQDCIEHNSANVNFLEEQIATLQKKLDLKTAEYDELDAVVAKAQETVLNGYAAAPGLAIRMLNKHLLSVVLSYLNLEGGINLVSKYWRDMTGNNRKQLPSGAELVHREVKMNKKDIASALLAIQFNKNERHRKENSSKNNEHSSTAVSPNGLSKTGNSAKQTSTKVSEHSQKQQQHSVISDDDSAMDSDLNEEEEPSFCSPLSPSKPVDMSKLRRTNSAHSPPSRFTAPLVRNHSARSDKGPGVQVSFDNMLSTASPNVMMKHSNAFTTKQHHMLTPEEKGKMAGNGDSKKHPNEPSSRTAQQVSGREVVEHDNLNNYKSNNDSSNSNSKAVDSHSSRLTSYIESNSTRRKEGNDIQQPVVTHENNNRKQKSSRGQRPSSTLTSGQTKDIAAPDRSLLQHVKKIRSEQQLTAMLEYIQAGFDKIETLSTEKRRIKKLIRAWNASFEKKNSRLPTSAERKGHLRELYEEYQQSSLALRIRTEKMEEVLKGVGLDRETFEQLRDKHQIA